MRFDNVTGEMVTLPAECLRSSSPVDVPRDSIRKLLDDRLEDERVQALRLRVATALPARLAENGLRLVHSSPAGGRRGGSGVCHRDRNGRRTR